MNQAQKHTSKEMFSQNPFINNIDYFPSSFDRNSIFQDEPDLE